MARSRKSLRERNQTVLGIIGLALSALIVAATLNISAIQSLLGETTFEATLSDAGGARAGDDVRVDGLTVGSVKSVTLDGKVVRLTFRAGDVTLGDKTTVAVRSDNALGSKYLAVEPAGTGSETTVPLDRTSPGYAVSEVLGKLTSNNQQIDVAQVAKSFESLTAVLDASPEEFGSALEGVSKLSKTISSRDAELRTLLDKASGVSGVLADRNQQLTDIMTRGSAVFREINERRELLSRLFAEVGRAADQIRAFTDENRATLTPKLKELNQLAKTLAKYRGDIDFTLESLPKYIRSLGEAVGSGPFFNAYLSNIAAPESLLSVDNVIKDILTENPAE